MRTAASRTDGAQVPRDLSDRSRLQGTRSELPGNAQRLGPAACTFVRARMGHACCDVPVSNNMSVRGAQKEHPREMDTTHSTNKAYSSMADTNAKVMLLPAFAGSKQGLSGPFQV